VSPLVNPHKQLAQARKRDALCALIEKNCASSGLDLFAHAIEIVELIENFHPSIWDQLADDAGINRPSDEVKEMVKARFRSRIDNRPQVPFAPAANDTRWGR
jgi:hypothetical protein